jgi:hypothetical protein
MERQIAMAAALGFRPKKKTAKNSALDFVETGKMVKEKKRREKQRKENKRKMDEKTAKNGEKMAKRK